MWDFITFHVRKAREARHEDDTKRSVANVAATKTSKNKKKGWCCCIVAVDLLSLRYYFYCVVLNR